MKQVGRMCTYVVASHHEEVYGSERHLQPEKNSKDGSKERVR